MLRLAEFLIPALLLPVRHGRWPYRPSSQGEVLILVTEGCGSTLPTGRSQLDAGCAVPAIPVHALAPHEVALEHGENAGLPLVSGRKRRPRAQDPAAAAGETAGVSGANAAATNAASLDFGA